MESFISGQRVSSSPALVNATLYVGSEDGRLYAVDAATGEKLWDFLTGDKITSSPAMAEGTVYISSHDGCLYAIAQKGTDIAQKGTDIAQTGTDIAQKGTSQARALDRL